MYQTTLELLTQLLLNALLGIFLFMFIYCCVQSLIDITVVLCKKDLEKQDAKVYYGELHSLHPDTRSFEISEPVYWRSNRYYVFWFETYDLTERTILNIYRHHGLYARAVDSREVKKIVRGK